MDHENGPSNGSGIENSRGTLRFLLDSQLLRMEDTQSLRPRAGQSWFT